jgi:CBS domain-containing protein
MPDASPPASSPAERAPVSAARSRSGLAELLTIPVPDRPRAATVRQVMTRRVLTTTPAASLLEAADLLRRHHISGLPVVSAKGELAGVLSEKDILADLERSVGLGRPRGMLELILDVEGRSQFPRIGPCLQRLRHARVKDAMTHRVVSVDPDASVAEAGRLMYQFHVSRLPVVEDGLLVGLVTHENLLRVFDVADPGR